MAKKRKWLLLKIVISVVVLMAASVWYINKFILPTKARAFFIETLKTQTNRDVSLADIHYNIFTGITVKDLVIYDNPQYGKREFLKIETASFNFLYFPIFKEKKIFIPAVYISRPHLVLESQAEDTWNFSDMPFLEELGQSKQIKQKFSFIVRRINISDGQVSFRDNSPTHSFSKDIFVDSISLSLGLPAAVKFRALIKIANADTEPTAMKIQGEIYPYKKYASLKFSARALSVPEYRVYYAQILPVNLLNGIADMKMDLSLKDDKITGSLESDVKRLSIKEGDFSLTADAVMESNFKYSVGNKNSLTYEGSALVKNCTMKGMPLINTVTNAQGKVTFSEQILKVEQMQGVFYDSPISLTGYLKDYLNLYIDFQINFKLDLARLKYLLPQAVYENFKDFKTAGKSQIAAQLKGYPQKKDTPLGFVIKADITEGELFVPYLQKPVTEISGNAHIDNNKLIWKNAKFKYGDYNITSFGSIVNFNEPYVEADVLSKGISLSTNFNIKEKVISLNKFDGSFLNSNFALLGNITDFSNPLLNIYGKVKLDLAGIKPVVPKQIQGMLTSLNIAGICDASLILNGQLKDWQNWDLIIKAQSPVISASGFKLKDVYVDYRMKDKFVYLREMAATPYEGVLAADASLNLQSEDNPYVINVEIKDVNLALLKQDTAFAKKDISGLLKIKATFNGYGMGLDKLKGGGYLYVKDGKLWEIPLLSGIPSLLFTPEFDKIIFKNAVGSFLIQDKNIYTNDFQLASDEVILLWEGRLGFDTSLDFSITTHLTEEFVAKSSTLGKLTTVILGQAGRFVDMRLTGTLSQPKYAVVPFPVGKIFNSDVIRKIRGIFGDIFE